MSEDLIEITCVKCGRTILVRDRWDTCPAEGCRVRNAGFEDDKLDVAIDELVAELKSIVRKLRHVGERTYERDHDDR